MRQKQHNKQKDILFILISSFVVVFAWIVFNIIHILSNSTVSPDVQAQLMPIPPNFDSRVMQQLKSRENINPLFENQASTSATTITTTPTPNFLTPLGAGVITPSPAENSVASNSSQSIPDTSPINIQGQ
ncbi:MAG TPA: hypothetical protein VNW29_06525 [Candidatus Sulfotelmatobacter sp.]|jgi:hypothetical protein|nr:hypothetical protein [Candidatus Sulfotelmatobacter sp.]